MPQYFGQLPVVSQAWTEIKEIKSIEKSGFSESEQGEKFLILTTNSEKVKISVLAPNLVRVRYAPTGEFLPRRSWAIASADNAWDKVYCQFQETASHLEITTEKIKILIQKHPFRIQFFNHQNQAFATDADPAFGTKNGKVAAWKKIAPEEHFYGFGERTGLLNKRSEIKTNWTIDCVDYDSLTDEMYQAIPFFVALRPELAYGIFLNSTYWSRFDLGVEQPGVWRMETQSPELDYYLIYGPEPAQILQTYTQLTGRMPLPPKWSLGYHQCRWSYESAEVVCEIAKEFRARQIPCDVIHLDIDYMQGYRVFTWSSKRFADPKALIKDLTENGFKTVTIVDPGVKYEPESDYHVFDQGLEQDLFVRKPDGELFYGYVWPEKAVFPDFLRPEVRQWWGDWHHVLTDAGVAGIWNDMNEPSIADRPFGDDGNKIWFPLNALQGPKDERATHAETHNLYGQMMAKACFEGLEKLRQERSFVLTRSGNAGIQRYSSVWMGDNQSLWEHLELSLPMLANMGLSGVAFVGCDIGGFAGNATAELFARWMQVGMLYPLMRGHSALTTAQHEPWVFGERTEQICRAYIELRYRLLPYFYTLVWEAARTGAPILRPLLYHFPQDLKTYELYDQILLGAGIMAAPVYRPGVEYRAVYLPEGVWYDWYTGDRYSGETHLLAHAPLEIMPLYVQAGSIIPLQPVMQYTEERPVDELTLRVYPGMGEFTLYEDDGKSFEYREGIFATTTYRVYPEQNQMVLAVDERQGAWIPHPREVVVEMVGLGEVRFTDDGTARVLRFVNQE